MDADNEAVGWLIESPLYEYKCIPPLRDNNYVVEHGNIGLGERHEEGDRVGLVEFANTVDLVIANTWFTKTRNQLITFKSGNSESQIDYILTNRRSLKDIINCKTIPGEAVVSQHRLVVISGVSTHSGAHRQYLIWGPCLACSKS